MTLQKMSEVMSTNNGLSKGDIKILNNVDCKKCGVHLEEFKQECIAPDFGTGIFYPYFPVCEPCLKRLEASAISPDEDEEFKSSDEGKKSVRKKCFDEMCPPSMAETIISRIPDQQSYMKVMQKNIRSKGLKICGKTGMGKTRTMWMLAKKLMIENDRVVTVFSSIELKEYMAKSHTIANGYNNAMSSLLSPEILMIDDLGKEKMSQTWEQDIFHLIDRRCQYRKQIVLTTNKTDQGIKDIYGQAFARRIEESCERIQFS